MSSRNLARRTKAEVSFGGVNITKSIQPYLLSITYTDNEEDETDDLQIKIQDRDDLWLMHWLDEISENLSWASSSGGSGSGDAVVSEANKYLGTPYVWGGSSPSGFDCSGLVYYALNEAGINVPRTTAQGYKDMATPVNEATAQPGDLIYIEWYKYNRLDHVGIVEFVTQDGDGTYWVHTIEGNNHILGPTPSVVQRYTYRLDDDSASAAS